MIPTGRLWLCIALASVPAVAAPWWPLGGPLALLLDAALLMLALWDGRRLPPLAKLQVQRRLPQSMVVGERGAVVIEIGGAGSGAFRLAESPPQALRSEASALVGRCEPGQVSRVSYDIQPTARGRFAWAPAWLTLRSPLGLMARHGPLDIPGSLIVHPQIPSGGPLKVPSAAQARRLGPRSGPRHGHGAEFLHLRPLAAGDGLRAIDWKATARRGTPVVRQHAEERALTVMVILDLSRRMGQEVGGQTRLDLSIASALEVVRACQQSGDRVGMLAFGEAVRCHIPPSSGRRALPLIRKAMVELSPEAHDADPRLALDHLNSHRLQRSLLIVFTDVTRLGADAALGPLTAASRRHEVMLAGVEDTGLRALASGLPRDGSQALVKGASLQLIHEQSEAARALGHTGAWVVEVPPGALASTVVGRYLSLRMRG